MFEALLSRWGYLAIGLGAFVEGEAVLLTAGAMAQARALSLPLVVLAGAVGSAAWGQTWFQLGRGAGKALLARRPSWHARARRVEGWLSRSGTLLLLCGRFMAGFGTVLPGVVGASGFPRRRFLIVDGLGALLWATVLAGGGFALGAGLRRVAGQSVGWPGLAAVAVGASILAWFLTRAFSVHGTRRQTNRPLGQYSRPIASKRVIITGDDFGLARPLNEAVELAYRHGILTTTSLLIGGGAASDAVARARRNPELRIGLHIAVCEGTPTLPPAEIPLLVNARGELFGPIVALFRFLLCAARPALHRQLEAEIRAQFAAFNRTGLALDHVNGHNNMQLHPVVLPILLRVAKDHAASAMRVPYEPLLPAWRASGRRRFFLRLLTWLVMCPWCAYVKRRVEREGLVVNDYLFGVFDCGAMDRGLFAGTLANLPPGLSEIHCHPAIGRCPQLDRDMPGYAHEAEFEALIDPAVREALENAGVQSLSGFASACRGSRQNPSD